ncbi:MAG: divalent-cation tolerance protein CutA [Gammaproteobacteria bacterium]|nr:divalent-cation tolerance protein CutA [Gammaproteobacteria bacterium]
MDNYILVLNTCNSAEIASKIAETLVSKKLAACVNIVNGVESVYQWQEKIEHDKELLLIIKTRQSLFSQLEHEIQELHDYELPEIIAVPIEAGEKNYLNWIKSATNATEI